MTTIRPYRHDWLPVGGGHRLYFEEVGNPAGVPVVFLHGGPGSGCKPEHRQYFDPDMQRAILFDQRGCGRSEPLGSLVANTTAHLLADMESLRQALGIERWIVFGGSWGSTLALLYSLAHPAAVAGLLLRGVFLASRAEIDWFLTGLGHELPEARAALDAVLAPGEQTNPIRALARRTASADFSTRAAAARAWLAWEAATMDASADPQPSPAQLAKAIVQLHYLAHDCLLDSADLLRRLPELAGIPTIIVQGGQDHVCPPHTAQAVAAAIPGAELLLLADQGHSGLSPPMADAQRAALARLAEKYGNS